MRQGATAALLASCCLSTSASPLSNHRPHAAAAPRRTRGEDLQHEDEVRDDLHGGALEVEAQQRALAEEGQAQERLWVGGWWAGGAGRG